jgi:hypothetical protein
MRLVLLLPSGISLDDVDDLIDAAKSCHGEDIDILFLRHTGHNSFPLVFGELAMRGQVTEVSSFYRKYLAKPQDILICCRRRHLWWVIRTCARLWYQGTCTQAWYFNIRTVWPLWLNDRIPLPAEPAP